MVTIGTVCGVLFAVVLLIGLVGIWIGYDLGVARTEKRWSDIVTKARVRRVSRCEQCGHAKGEEW